MLPNILGGGVGLDTDMMGVSVTSMFSVSEFDQLSNDSCTQCKCYNDCDIAVYIGNIFQCLYMYHVLFVSIRRIKTNML